MPDEEGQAENALEELGLTEYEAKCFVALTRISEGSAKEISRISDVPRSRVYDTVERLHQRGLVDIQQSEPRKYRLISKDAAFERLRQDYRSSIEAADEALEEVQSSKTSEEKGTWAIADYDHVGDRMLELLRDADARAHLLIADEAVVRDGVLEELAEASDRGLTVVVETPTETVRERVQQAVPEAQVVVSKGLNETQKVVKRWPGQLLMVDQRAVLASGIEESQLPDVTEETAVWSPGRDHGIAAWVRELLEDRAETFDASD